MQVLLLALFEAQCRTPASARQPTKIPLRHAPEAGTSWLHLTALPTVDTQRRRTHPRTPDDNRYNQLLAALKRLYDLGRIRGRSAGRGRFENFALLHEATDNLTSEIAYTRPRTEEPMLEVPVEFFMNGWVHALSDAEIATYLYLLLRRDELARTGADPNVGIPIPRSEWTWAFGGYRTYEAHRHLTRFGLIDVELPDGRRPDGTVKRGGDEDTELPYEAHVFRILDDGLGYRAVETVLKALEHVHDLDIAEATQLLPLSGLLDNRPNGWRCTDAKTAITEARLAL